MILDGGIVEVNVDKKSEKHIEVELVGEDNSLPSMVVHELHQNPDVEFAACILEHPVIGSPKIIVKTKSKPASDALKKAVGSVEKQVKDFSAKIKKVREKK